MEEKQVNMTHGWVFLTYTFESLGAERQNLTELIFNQH